MKSGTVTLTFLLLGILTINSFAQPAQPGDLGIYFDEDATTTSVDNIAPFEVFEFFVIATDVPRGQQAFEFIINGDPRVAFSTEIFDFEFLLNFAPSIGPTIRNYRVGLGGICAGLGTPVTLVHWEALLLDDHTDLTFCLEGSQPSSLSPPRPAYVPCDQVAEVLSYGAAYEGCAVLNPLTLEPPIATEAVSWGSMKSRF